MLINWLKTGLLNRFDFPLRRNSIVLICLFTNSKKDKWRSRRRLITPSFYDNQLLQSLMSIFSEKACALVDRWAALAKQSTAYDLYPYISACTLDIITGSILTFISEQCLLDNILEAATGKRVDAQLMKGENAHVQAVAS